MAMDQHQKKRAQFSGAYLFLAFAALFLIQGVIAKRTAPKTVPMSDCCSRCGTARSPRS